MRRLYSFIILLLSISFITSICFSQEWIDLTGTWTSMEYTCKETSSGLKCKIKGVLNIQNTGNEAAGATVRFYLSNDNIYDGSNMPLSEVWSDNVKIRNS